MLTIDIIVGKNGQGISCSVLIIDAPLWGIWGMIPLGVL